MKNKLIRLLLSTAAVTLLMPSLPFGIVQSSLSAQTTTTQTVLTAAITTTTSTQVTVASNTGFSVSTATQEYDIWVDGEMMKVQSQVGTSNTYVVSRAVNRTRATAHPTGSLVFFGPAGRGPFVSQPPWPGSSCTVTSYQYMPLVVYGPAVSTGTNGALIANCTGSVWNITSLAPNNDLRPTKMINDTAYTALLSDEFIIFQQLSAGRTVTLPAITGLIGKTYVISNSTTNGSTITVATSANQLFGTGQGPFAASSITFSGSGNAIRLVSSLVGSSWIWSTW